MTWSISIASECGSKNWRSTPNPNVRKASAEHDVELNFTSAVILIGGVQVLL
jgi:hypothetical protein